MRLTAWTRWAFCRARTNIVPKPRDSASDAGLADTYLASPAQPRIRIGLGDNSCSGTPGRAPGDLFSSSVCPPPALRVRARSAESSGCGRGRRACGRAAQPPSRPQTHLRIPRLRRLAARACHAPAPAADSRSDFGVAYCCRSFAEYRLSLQPSAGLKRAHAAFARALRAFIAESNGQVLCMDRGRREDDECLRAEGSDVEGATIINWNH